MITLNRERGFEHVETWEEILQLPGFTLDLDPKAEELKEIIGRYMFRDKIACGLSVCRQPHGRGCIATTKSGKVTNIGNVCGKNHFGVKFDEFSRVFTQALTDHQNRETVASFQFRLDSLEAEVEELRTADRGADWVYRTTRALVQRNRGCPDSLVAAVGNMVRSRSGSIRVSRDATEEEAKELEVAAGRNLPRPQYVEEVQGVLRGLTCLYPEHDIREILVLDVEPNLAKLREMDAPAATSQELRFWSKWCGELEEKLDRARSAVEAGNVLLTRENLAQMFVTVHDPKQLTEFKKWLAKAVGS
ncbi:hypothetical protein [Algiphilus sp.]|uniref:hypothetical protein n=1 Tax=Algiphilus sp. TaxID=1872431 RepID=UPI003BAD188D